MTVGPLEHPPRPLHSCLTAISTSLIVSPSAAGAPPWLNLKPRHVSISVIVRFAYVSESSRLHTCRVCGACGSGHGCRALQRERAAWLGPLAGACVAKCSMVVIKWPLQMLRLPIWEHPASRQSPQRAACAWGQLLAPPGRCLPPSAHHGPAPPPPCTPPLAVCSRAAVCAEHCAECWRRRPWRTTAPCSVRLV